MMDDVMQSDQNNYDINDRIEKPRKKLKYQKFKTRKVKTSDVGMLYQ